MNQDRLLTIIQQLENDIARVEDAMESARLAIKRLMADMKAERGEAGQGPAWLGSARPGMAGQGVARQGKEL
jgi:hypothetical protein